jgi:hypothetical protein
VTFTARDLLILVISNREGCVRTMKWKLSIWHMMRGAFKIFETSER